MNNNDSISNNKSYSEPIVRLKNSSSGNKNFIKTTHNSLTVLRRKKTSEKKLTKRISFENLPTFNFKNNLNNNPDINTVISYILITKLKIYDIDSNTYSKIFKDNLIINYEILCNQNPDVVDKLNLPLALSTEIKNIIINENEKNKLFQCISYHNLTLETKNKIKYILELFIKDNQYFSTLFDTYYKKSFEIDHQLKYLLQDKSLNIKSKILVNLLKNIIFFINNEYNVFPEIEKDIVAYMIYKINIDNYTNIATVLADTISNILNNCSNTVNNEYIRDLVKVVVVEFANNIIKYYDNISKGKKYYIHYYYNIKWRKAFCTITNQDIIISKYSSNTVIKQIKIKDIVNYEYVDDGDIRIVKKTNYCLRIIPKIKDDIYICTDTNMYIKSIYDDIKIRVEAYEFIN